MESSVNEIPWKILNKYFKEETHFLVTHHLKSYNDFFETGITQLLKEKNPIHFFKERESITTDDETKHIGYTTALGESIPLTYTEMINLYPTKSEEELRHQWESATGSGPVKTNTRQDYKYQCKLYIGGRNGNQIYYGKPIIYDDERRRYSLSP